MGLKADLDRAAWFCIRWAAASLWLGITFVIVGALYGILPESITQGRGGVFLLVWAVVAYVGGHYGIWHR